MDVKPAFFYAEPSISSQPVCINNVVCIERVPVYFVAAPPVVYSRLRFPPLQPGGGRPTRRPEDEHIIRGWMDKAAAQASYETYMPCMSCIVRANIGKRASRVWYSTSSL